MKNTAVYNYYKDLPPIVKGIVIIGGGLIAWFGILNPVRRLIISKLNAEKMAKEGKEAGRELAELKKKGISPTITAAQAQSFSNSLISAFSGCGTDENAVYGVFQQMKNDADVYLLISTYGLRKYDGCNWEMNFGDTEKSLSGAISDELDWLEKSVINGILEKNKIKYKVT